jgi:hypothetical protein
VSRLVIRYRRADRLKTLVVYGVALKYQRVSVGDETDAPKAIRGEDLGSYGFEAGQYSRGGMTKTVASPSRNKCHFRPGYLQEI